jgi:hypothetical protein
MTDVSRHKTGHDIQVPGYLIRPKVLRAEAEGKSMIKRQAEGKRMQDL